MAKLVIGTDSDDGVRMARVFWIGLDRPPRFNTKKFMDNWAPRMDTLMRKAGMGYEDFKWFIVWATRLRDADGANYGNNYSAEFLRVAQDPMRSLEKNFPRLMFEIYSDASSQKKLPYLKDVVQKERDLMLRDYAPPQRTLSYLDVIPEDPMRGSEKWRREWARWLTAADKRFPKLEPAPGEDMDDFVHRMFAPFSDNRKWRCPTCKYNPSATGVGNAPSMVSVCKTHGYNPCPEQYSVAYDERCTRQWTESGDETVERVVWYGEEERLQWCGDCWEEYVADRDMDIIIHAQDNNWWEAQILDLLLAWKP